MRYQKHGAALAEQGYDTTPLKGKVPMLTGWQSRPEAAQDFAKYASANIGIVLGGEHNIIAADIDVRDAEAASEIKALAIDILGAAPERIGAAPKTMLIYRAAAPATKRKTAVYDVDGNDACVEILGSGQQFVASGIHPDTKQKYKWPKDSLMDYPASELPQVTADDISEFLAAANTVLSNHGAIKSKSLSNGSDSSMRRLDFSSHPKEAEHNRIMAALAYVPNEDVHYDDWVYMAHAVKGALGDNAPARDLFHRWSERSDKHDAAECERLWKSIGDVKTIGAGTIFHMAADHGYPLGGEADKSPETATENSDALPLVWARDMEAVTDTTDFVEDLLGEGQMSVVYGESNSGKTFWATDLAMHVAAGKAWFGREVETGGVIYVALEGGFGIRNRVAAWKLHHGVSDMAFGVIPTSINMLDPDADTPRLIDSIRGAAKSIDAPIRMVVIDTLSRALAGGNENSSEDLGACVMNADRVRNETGAHVMFIHHSGKDQAKGARGHSLLRAATDTEIEITRDHDAGVSISRVAKQREMEIGGEMAFELVSMQLGENKRGKPVTSCVIKSVEAGAKRQKKLRPGSVDAQMMKHIHRMFMEDGIPFKAHPEAGMPLINVVTQDQLRGYLVDAGWLETGNVGGETGNVGVLPASRKKKSNTLNRLENLGYLGQTKNHVWLLENQNR